jgi:hypothetical protein
MANEVVVTADRLKKRQKIGRIVKTSLLILLLSLIVLYIILQVIYNEGKFTVTLDPNSTLKSGLAMYESLNDPTPKRKLYANSIKFMDNISIKWLPTTIKNEDGGSHNGDNYIAYTFYLENQGTDVINYWYKVVTDDIIKNVDEAVRIMIYRNDDATVYAKASSTTKEAEEGTVKFRTDEDGTIILEQRQDFKPGDVDKYTIVVWIEGDDPECTNALLGGEIKMHMDITEEHIDQ